MPSPFTLQCCRGCLTLAGETIQLMGWKAVSGLLAVILYLFGVLFLCGWTMAHESGYIILLAVIVFISSMPVVAATVIGAMIYYCVQTTQQPGYVMPCARPAEEQEGLLDNSMDSKENIAG